MRRCLFKIACGALAAVGLVGADSLPANRLDSAAERCAGEVATMRGVWRSAQVFLPFYGDLDLVLYLASLRDVGAGVAAVPVFSTEPVIFRSDHVVFVSTGFILKAESERELVDAMRNAPVAVRTGDLPTCTGMAAWTAGSFADMRLRLRGQVAGYEDLAVRQLRRR